MPILAGIDGTGGDITPGAGRDQRYDKAFADSFVTRLCRNKAYAGYWRAIDRLGFTLKQKFPVPVGCVETRGGFRAK